MAIKNKAGTVVRRFVNGQVQILLFRQVSADYWQISKGHMENGESPEQTAIRELKEETGLEVKFSLFCHKCAIGRMRGMMFI